jgi:hypothetical protein
VLESGEGFTEHQRRQLETAVQNLPPHIDREAIRAFLDTVRYPLYHLDFETCQQAIPLWDGVSPYMQIPFQYSLHIQNAPCGPVAHREFLGKEGADPRRSLVERLCSDIPPNACVMAYNMTFEKGVIKKLAEIAAVRTALLAYCRLDSLAMVKILEKLYHI